MITLLYLLICWLSYDISVDYKILTATVVLDILWTITGILHYNKK